jgi:hypothetical protein
VATFDFNTLMETAKSASFEALPDGPYDAECISADAVTSTTGKPMIKCKFEVIAGPHAKRKFFNQFVLSTDNEVALAMFFRHMKAFGLDENFFKAVGSGGLGPVAQTMVGRRARFDLGHREWNGENRNEVKSVKPITGGVSTGGLPGAAAPVAPGLPGLPGLPTSSAPPVAAPPAPAVTQPTPPTPPQQAVPASPVQNGADPAAAAVAQPTPPPPAVVTEPAPPVQPQPPVQPVEAPAPVQAPVQPVQPATPAPVQPEPQPTPPAEQPVAVGAPAVTPPPPMPF